MGEPMDAPADVALEALEEAADFAALLRADFDRVFRESGIFCAREVSEIPHWGQE